MLGGSIVGSKTPFVGFVCWVHGVCFVRANGWNMTKSCWLKWYQLPRQKWRPVVPRRHRTSQSTITNNRLTMYAMKYDLLKHHKAYVVHAFKGCNVSHINTKIKKIEETHHNTICSPFPKHRRYPLNTPQHRDCRLHWPLPPTKAGDMHSTSYPTQQTVEWVPLSET